MFSRHALCKFAWERPELFKSNKQLFESSHHVGVYVRVPHWDDGIDKGRKNTRTADLFRFFAPGGLVKPRFQMCPNLPKSTLFAHNVRNSPSPCAKNPLNTFHLTTALNEVHNMTTKLNFSTGSFEITFSFLDPNTRRERT